MSRDLENRRKRIVALDLRDSRKGSASACNVDVGDAMPDEDIMISTIPSVPVHSPGVEGDESEVSPSTSQGHTRCFGTVVSLCLHTWQVKSQLPVAERSKDDIMISTIPSVPVHSPGVEGDESEVSPSTTAYTPDRKTARTRLSICQGHTRCFGTVVSLCLHTWQVKSISSPTRSIAYTPLNQSVEVSTFPKPYAIGPRVHPVDGDRSRRGGDAVRRMERRRSTDGMAAPDAAKRVAYQRWEHIKARAEAAPISSPTRSIAYTPLNQSDEWSVAEVLTEWQLPMPPRG
jgi:hypothetical protein